MTTTAPPAAGGEEHPLAAALRGAGPKLAAAMATMDRHPYLIAMPPLWALARTRENANTGYPAGDWRGGPTAGDSVCVWHPARWATEWSRGQFCWASLPTALHRATFGIRLRANFVRGGLRPHMVYLTQREAVLLAAFEHEKLVPALLPDRLIVEPVAMAFDLEDGGLPEDAAERLAIVFTSHGLRHEGNDDIADTYGSAAALAAVCTGDVDGRKILGATEPDLIETFRHTDMLRIVGLTHESAGDLRITTDSLPRWCSDVPAWIAAHRERLDELERRARERDGEWERPERAHDD